MGRQFANVLSIKKCDICGEYNNENDLQCMHCHGLLGEDTIVKEIIVRRFNRELNRFIWLALFPIFLFLVILYPRFIMLLAVMFLRLGWRLPRITQLLLDYCYSAIYFPYIYIIIFGILVGLFYTFKRFFYYNVFIPCKKNEPLIGFLIGVLIGFTLIAMFMPILILVS